MNIYGAALYNCGFRHGSRVTVEDHDDIVDAYEATRHYGALSVKIQHQPVNDLRFGRVENLRREGELLLGDLINVPNGLPERFRYISAETVTPFTFSGRTFKRRLTAVSLTDRPGCYGLCDVFGNKSEELVVRPTGEHGFEAFTMENEDALIACESLLDNDGDEWELEAEASGHGLVSIGLCPHLADGTPVEQFHRFAACELHGETRRLYGRGRIKGGGFPMIAAAFDVRTSGRLDVPWLSIRRVAA